MIVMKFGGSSLASAAAIGRVLTIIRPEAGRQPVIVTSAMGDTTDQLLELLSAARKGNSYSAWKLQEGIRNQHFAACEELLHGEQMSWMNRYLRDTFRDLHVRMLEVSEGERTCNRELQDWTLSLGEQLSSRLLAAMLQEHNGATVHLDARKLILTDDAFTNAQPMYWESYARIRWAVPVEAREHLVVLGGFIGSTEDGRTTTLGRGGSDLTAAIVGAAINAEEIQVWKDVDGMLTCDPRLLAGGLPVRRISYEEASELAAAGANILHPETVTPAKRLRIPLVIRNTFRPEAQGTRIDCALEENGTPDGYVIKSVAVKSNVTLLEIRAAHTVDDAGLVALCSRQGSEATVLFASEQLRYVALSESAYVPEESCVREGCYEVKMRRGQAILTLVGRICEREALSRRLSAALHGITPFILPSDASAPSIRVAVPQEHLKRCLQLLHEAFFSDPDARVFALESKRATPANTLSLNYATPRRTKRPPAFTLSRGQLQMN